MPGLAQIAAGAVAGPSLSQTALRRATRFQRPRRSWRWTPGGASPLHGSMYVARYSRGERGNGGPIMESGAALTCRPRTTSPAFTATRGLASQLTPAPYFPILHH